MAMTNYPNGFAYGVSIRGVPLEIVPPGKVFFVSSAVGSDSGKGTKDRPFATLDYAIGRCTGSKGDIIFLMPGHAENLTVATSVDIDVAGVSIIGLGTGNLIPTFSTTAAAGSITVEAANVLIQNIRIYSNFATGTTTGLTIAADGDGLTIRGLQMREAANTSEFLTWIAVATTVTDLVMEDCELVGIIGGSDINVIIFAGTSSNCIFRNNLIFADCSGDLIDHNTGASVNIGLFGNRLINMDTGAAGDCFSNNAAGTGFAFDNYGFYNKVDATVWTGAAMNWDQNSAGNTLASSGIRPHPAAVAAVP